MKKLMLVGLVLLASVMVLVGCKNDSVPEVPPAKLDSITSLVQSAFSKDEIGDTMMVVVTYDNGTTKTVEGTIISDSSELRQSHGLNKEVTVSYSEGGITKEATFTIDVASYKFTETVQEADSAYQGTMSGGTYKKFGDWPQTIMGTGVTVGSGTLVRGGFTYHVGSDGNYYVQEVENPYNTGDEYKYSDGTQPINDSKYFKVEPIIWRVLSSNYNSTGNALMLAEKILTGNIPYYYSIYTRAGPVYPNNYKYSTIRAWLNGKYEKEDTQKKTYENKGFLQTAFTTNGQKLIKPTLVDNSAKSTNPDMHPNLWGNGDNIYACDDTLDKIFLLSMKEATTTNYGFDDYNVTTSTRIRVATDYAKAGRIELGSKGGCWWLRSPSYVENRLVRYIHYEKASPTSNSAAFNIYGVVPALCIKL